MIVCRQGMSTGCNCMIWYWTGMTDVFLWDMWGILVTRVQREVVGILMTRVQMVVVVWEQLGMTMFMWGILVAEVQREEVGILVTRVQMVVVGRVMGVVCEQLG